jgi:hypothetical protein
MSLLAPKPLAVSATDSIQFIVSDDPEALAKRRQYAKEYRQKNRERLNEISRRHYHQRKGQVPDNLKELFGIACGDVNTLFTDYRRIIALHPELKTPLVEMLKNMD